MTREESVYCSKIRDARQRWNVPWTKHHRARGEIKPWRAPVVASGNAVPMGITNKKNGGACAGGVNKHSTPELIQERYNTKVSGERCKEETSVV